ncbi:hypothetical protein [Yimella sp. cx-51]|uniref:hypothetical protein n=1 Tax=Yimella sp. cx-51 TaxID=2770551 RepID=UPI00165DF6A5|nr:hypothetical protein [Yimella sp. cx-51]MBC9956687.1 hypothetical protein [Yimella sp. cx-51]MBD2759115.1 hypothetical protein [Yimella sp. cx-573]QTH38926.1 hypothetical protein J5M86_04645 [Yimella sp. cx-51]
MPADTIRPLLAPGLMAVQTVGLIAFALWSGIDGGSARSWSFAATLIVLAACTAVLAFLLSQRRAAARTPTLLWNALLVPIGFSVGDGGAPWVGWLIIGLAAATFVATLLVPTEPAD